MALLENGPIFSKNIFSTMTSRMMTSSSQNQKIKLAFHKL